MALVILQEIFCKELEIEFWTIDEFFFFLGQYRRVVVISTFVTWLSDTIL
jgi:hypothetical protein